MPPARMPRASLRLILRMASPKICATCGTAFSAARFMLSSKASTLAPWPSLRARLAACSSLPGSGMRTLGLFQKPPLRPRLLIALVVPLASASLSPAAMSLPGRLLPAADAPWADLTLSSRFLNWSAPAAAVRLAVARANASRA